MIVLVLIALAARANAKPTDDPFALAIRYANLLTGVDLDADATDAAAGAGDPGTDAETISSAELFTDSDAGFVTDSDVDLDTEIDAITDTDAATAAHAVTGTVSDTDTVADPDTDPDPIADTDTVADTDAVADIDTVTVADAVADTDTITVADTVADTDTITVADTVADAVPVADMMTAGIASAGAPEIYETRVRDRRSSRWGRVDLGLEWQRRRRDPPHEPAYRVDEIWLVATWRR